MTVFLRRAWSEWNQVSLYGERPYLGSKTSQHLQLWHLCTHCNKQINMTRLSALAAYRTAKQSWQHWAERQIIWHFYRFSMAALPGRPISLVTIQKILNSWPDNRGGHVLVQLPCVTWLIWERLLDSRHCVLWAYVKRNVLLLGIGGKNITPMQFAYTSQKAVALCSFTVVREPLRVSWLCFRGSVSQHPIKKIR